MDILATLILSLAFTFGAIYFGVVYWCCSEGGHYLTVKKAFWQSLKYGLAALVVYGAIFWGVYENLIKPIIEVNQWIQ